MRNDPTALMSPLASLLTATAKMKLDPPNLLSEPVTPRDLVSIHDLSPAEIGSLFNLTAMLKQRPADFRNALAGKQMVMFLREALAAYPPHLRSRNGQYGRQHIFLRPDRQPSQRPRVSL